VRDRVGRTRSAGFCQLALRTNAAVGVLCELSATWVRPSRMRSMVSLPALTIGSQPMIRSAAGHADAGGADVLLVFADQHMAPGGAALLGQTARILRDDALALDMRRHAEQLADGDDAGTADARHDDAPDLAGRRGQRPRGRFGQRPSSNGDKALSLAFFFSCPPSTVTKLGQKPLRQDMSLLQVDWLIWRLRPNSVSSGSTLMQLDCTPQSPQPSQTSSLMTTRLAGSTIARACAGGASRWRRSGRR
jgi:hypothetical protein